MDDLTSAISQILQNPDSMNQLRAAAQALGLNPDGPPPAGLENVLGGMAGQGGQSGPQQPQNPPPPPPSQPQQSSGQPAQQTPDLSALASLLGGMGGMGGQAQQPQTPGIDPATLKLISGAVSKLNSSDKNVDLLRALKPHFSAGRASRVDDAIRLLQLFSMLPLLRESGLLDRFLGGGRR